MSRKIICLTLGILLLICCVACAAEQGAEPNQYPPSFQLNGVIYQSTGQALDVPLEVDSQLPCIHSTMAEELMGWPEEDGQANFDCLGAPYMDSGDGTALLRQNDQWILFQARDDLLPAEPAA